MSKIAELLGVFCSKEVDLTKGLKDSICPFSHKKCYKTRKSASDTVIGTCSVERDGKNIIICPNRLLENNQIFVDCLHLLSSHEPGNELYLIPEVSVPGGLVDFFLVSAKEGKIKDFLGIEIQALDTIGSIWPERQRLLKEHGIDVDPADLDDVRSFGINWKMTAKTTLLQLRHKSETFEKMNKRLVLVVQTPLFNYFKQKFSFSHVKGVRLGDSVHFHVYDLKSSERSLKLSFETRVSSDSAGVARCLGMNASARVDFDKFVATLEQRLEEKYRLTILQSL